MLVKTHNDFTLGHPIVTGDSYVTIEILLKNHVNNQTMWMAKVRTVPHRIFTKYMRIKIGTWLGRIATVAWEVGALEDARTYFAIDDDSSFAQQQVLLLKCLHRLGSF